MKVKFRIIHPYSGENDERNIYLPNFNVEDDCVYMAPSLYKLIFGTKRSSDCARNKRLAIIKIKSNRSNNSIYRQYYGMSLSQPRPIAISQKSLRQLSNDEKSILEDTFTISKGSRFLYYWCHPFHSTRISTKLGVISIILALFSMVLTIIMDYLN